jgi:membrane protease YdiL (CAAX protease family)
MNGLGKDGGDPFGEPRGEPSQPLLEASLFFIAFYLATYVSSGVPATAVTRPGFHVMVVAMNLPRALLILYVMAVGDGLRLFSIGRICPTDIARGFLTALGAFAAILVPGMLFLALGVENPLFAQARSEPRAGVALIPLILASSMATGYCEELFFRSYLMRRLGQAGLPVLWSAVASSLLFGSGHGYQGIIGVVSGSLLGLFFAWRWNASKNIHEIALGHGLFDMAVLALLAYS